MIRSVVGKEWGAQINAPVNTIDILVDTRVVINPMITFEYPGQ